MYLLHDSASGYALFRVLDETALTSLGPTGLSGDRHARDLLELVSFRQHASVQEALDAQVSSFQGELSSSLRRFIKKSFLELARARPQERLLVPEARLAAALREHYGLAASYQDAAVELGRLVRHCAPELIQGFSPEHDAQLALGLAHAFSRYRVKFGSGALDTMVIQAVSLMDDSEKELNTLSSRLREWESWHFSELEPLVENQLAYARTVAFIRSRAHMQTALDDPARREDFLHHLDEVSGGRALDIVRAANTSVGTDITEDDAARISALADEVVRLFSYREELHSYVQNRMAAIAPNFTAVVGPVVGARLIAKAGSLMNLAKCAASTVQVLGAERALFRAKKDRSGRTPKYGYIYHAEYVGRASQQNKGRMARAVAAAASLSARVDALSEGPIPEFAEGRLGRLGRALQYYEGGRASRAARKAQAVQKMGEYRRREGLGSSSRGRDVSGDVQPAQSVEPVAPGQPGQPDQAKPEEQAGPLAHAEPPERPGAAEAVGTAPTMKLTEVEPVPAKPAESLKTGKGEAKKEKHKRREEKREGKLGEEKARIEESGKSEGQGKPASLEPPGEAVENEPTNERSRDDGKKHRKHRDGKEAKATDVEGVEKGVKEERKEPQVQDEVKEVKQPKSPEGEKAEKEKPREREKSGNDESGGREKGEELEEEKKAKEGKEKREKKEKKEKHRHEHPEHHEHHGHHEAKQKK